MITQRHCPVCAYDKAEKLTEIDFLHLPSCPLPSHYDIVSCGKCGFVYNETNADENVFNRYYSGQSKYVSKNISGAGGFSKKDIEKYEKNIRFLEPHISSKDAAILDFGCAKGGQLLYLKEKFSNLTGVDPSTQCIDIVREMGIEAYTGSFLNIPEELNGKSYDLIILDSVLEHIFDFKSVFRAVDKLLKPDGILFIEVPDAFRYKDFFLAPYYRFDFEHINHFSKAHMENLLGSFSYDLISFRQEKLKVADGIFAPSISLLFKKSQKPRRLVPDFELREKIEEYIAKSEQAAVDNKIAGLYNMKTPVLIWGLGAYTSSLLKKTKLGQCNIKAFIDNDPNKRNKTFMGKPVYTSDFLKEQNDGTAVAVCSVLYKNEMLKFLDDIKYNADIILLV